MYWVLAILLLGILITLHEVGHFVAARLTGVGVIEFAVGFGPKLLSRKSKKSGIVYSLRALPLGGFCRFVGDESDPESAGRDDSYYSAKIWKRVVISLAGPLMNLLVGLLILIIISSTYGFAMYNPEPVIAKVVEEMPAQMAGFEVGDRIVSVNGEAMETTDSIATAIAAAGNTEIAFGILRGEENLTLDVTPLWIEAEGRSMIGIEYSYEVVKTGAFTAFGTIVTGIYRAIRDLFTTSTGIQNLSGPVGVVNMIKEGTQEYGLFAYLSLAAQISINLGLFNLLPIPGLDGSKLIFLAYEKIRGKPLDPNKEGIITLVGFVLLLGVMAFALYLDISRLTGAAP